MLEWMIHPEAWVSLFTLIALEIVLGIDNIIFITILASRLPEKERNKARQIGLLLAMGTRLILLFSIVWIMGLVNPWFNLFGNEISGRDLILIIGGLFLLVKSTLEIHNSLEIVHHDSKTPKANTFFSVLIQIALLDIVFSLDSVITAVGLAQHISIMVIAVIVSVGVMLLSAKAIGDFVEKNPTIKMLALSFLLMIGFTLIGEGFDLHIPKGYIYFAMAFSVGVELLNIKLRKRKEVQMIQLSKSIPLSDEVVK